LLMINDKKILLGVTGGIAAYKSVYLLRELVKRGAQVKVVMTPMARQFVGPLTFATLSHSPVYTDFFDKNTGQWHSHVELGLWADAFLIAPLTANTLAKMVTGQADNLLVTTYLSARCPVIVAPAMDLDMFRHPAVRQNLKILRSHGVHIIDAQEGELASGLIGKGRMAEPQDIVDFLENFFARSQQLKGKKALVTAGPTYEMIDPVRFIGNFSSGKMGFAIALDMADRGAQVTLVSGPTSLDIDHPNIHLIRVTSAIEMHSKATEIFPNMDIAVLAAAVADYRPSQMADKKIKKADNELVIRLVKNPDIAASLGKIKKPGQLLIGFALETDNEINNAMEKIRKKNFDFIVLNSLKDKGAGFGVDTNKVTFLFPEGRRKDFPLKAKSQVAQDIVDQIISLLKMQ
jgi:phosphopantothenoylcysteine decarboxylase/phosphopantothenate--cysteine ligase